MNDELEVALEFNVQTLVLLPIGLGLLGFVEPCTIGAHLLFLETQFKRSAAEKFRAVLIFLTARSVVTGLFGALIAYLGRTLIEFQTGFWLIFGLVYLMLGLLALTGRANQLRTRINLAPVNWKRADHPIFLGLAFGLNIPACAAPILFGLLGLAASSGTVAAGFSMMFLFGLFLSVPLVLFAIFPWLVHWLEVLREKMKRAPWIVGGVFVLLGVWSVWFGLYVDPANWAGR